MMVLVDTSVWIDFFHDRKTPHVEFLESCISESKNLCICGIILTEILQGIRNDKQYSKIKRYLENLLYLPMEYSTYLESAEVYRFLRKKGVTIRKPVDCMIASVALEHNVPILHNDKDFNPIEHHCGLQVVKFD